MQPRYAQERHTHPSSPTFDPGDITTAGFTGLYQAVCNGNTIPNVHGFDLSTAGSGAVGLPDAAGGTFPQRIHRIRYPTSVSATNGWHAKEAFNPTRGFKVKMWFSFDVSSFYTNPPANSSSFFFGIANKAVSVHSSTTWPFDLTTATDFAFGVGKDAGGNVLQWVAQKDTSTRSTSSISMTSAAGRVYCLTILQEAGSADLTGTLTNVNDAVSESWSYAGFSTADTMWPQARVAGPVADNTYLYMHGMTAVVPEIAYF